MWRPLLPGAVTHIGKLGQGFDKVGISTLLYYISWSFGYRNPNINIREIIWLGNQLMMGMMMIIHHCTMCTLFSIFFRGTEQAQTYLKI